VLELCRLLWCEHGYSASRVADELGAQFPQHAFTRNAVVGITFRKAWRQLKVYRPWAGAKIHIVEPVPVRKSAPSARGVFWPPRVSAVARRAQNASAASLAPAPGALPAVEGLVVPLPLDELKSGHCRWPVGDMTAEALASGPVAALFCARPVAESRCPYCFEHARLGWRPAPKRREVVPRLRINGTTNW